MLRLTVACLALAAAAATNATLQLLSGAHSLCLDGTQSGYYYSKASSANGTKWVIALEGGGECVTNASCADRALGDLGSSAGWAPTMGLGQLQSSWDGENPDCFDWHHVYLKYCTGDLFMGTVETPDSDNQWGWAKFDGALVVAELLNELKSENALGDATDVVWTGVSAGGIGSFAHVDAVAEFLPGAKVAAVPVAGFYFDYAPYAGPAAAQYVPFDNTAFAGYSKMWGGPDGMFVPQACADAVGSDDRHVCALAGNSWPTTATDTLFVEAQTDEVQMSLHAGVPSMGLPYVAASALRLCALH